ncbi:MAG: cyclic nucleotide-binding domain-containing protein [Nitrospinae bacterium]|nr:cyclic nucleotide-binding domain-containing protein [Nitrospinota bacterium]
MEMQQKLSALKKVSFSNYLQEGDLWYLLYSCKCIPIDSGETLFSEKDFKESMYIVLNGQIEIYRKNRHIAYRGVGEFFGEMALLESKPRSANARGVSNTMLLEVDRETFYNFLCTEPKIIWEISKTLSQRSREDLDFLDEGYRELKRNQEKLYKIINSVSDLIIQLDPNGIISFANESIQTLGYDVDVVVGKHLREICDCELDAETRKHVFTRRIQTRSLEEIKLSFKVNPDSSLYDFAHKLNYLVSTSGLRSMPEEVVVEKGSEKEFLGSLLIARSQLFEMNI